MQSIKLLLLTLLTFNAYAYAVDPLIEPTTTINCKMPIEREDGTPLAIDEIAKVTFYTGTSSGVYDVNNGKTNTICQTVVDNTILSDGTYYKVFTVKDTDGRVSKYSDERIHLVKRLAPPKAGTWLN